MPLDNLLEKVKKLREITGVGFKDCKSAIDENNGDIEKSIEYLRKKGIAKASKRMDRVAAEGLVCIYEKDNETPSYIGKSTTRSKGGIRQRLRQHLYGASYGTKTNSKYNKVKGAMDKNRTVGVKCILFKSEFIVNYVESELIFRVRQKNKNILWNKRN